MDQPLSITTLIGAVTTQHHQDRHVEEAFSSILSSWLERSGKRGIIENIWKCTNECKWVFEKLAKLLFFLDWSWLLSNHWTSWEQQLNQSIKDVVLFGSQYLVLSIELKVIQETTQVKQKKFTKWSPLNKQEKTDKDILPPFSQKTSNISNHQKQ